MNWLRWIGLCGVAVWLAVGCANAEDTEKKPSKEEAVVIPLSEIWGYRMPGTRDIRTLVDMKQIRQPLGIRVAGPSSFISRGEEKIAGRGFAVLGRGMKAFLAIHAELPEGQKPQDTFPFGSELSVVFFSHGFGRYVHIHRVEQQGNVITIRYRFVPHRTKNFSEHFALIPVNELQPGKVHVNIIRSSMERKYIEAWKPISAEEKRRVLCKSFSFLVSERK